MPEIEKRTFIEEKDLVAEKADWDARKLSPDARGWTSYCFFLPDATRDAIDREIRAKISKTYVQVVATQTPAGVWVRGARYELEAAIVALGRSSRSSGP